MLLSFSLFYINTRVLYPFAIPYSSCCILWKQWRCCLCVKFLLLILFFFTCARKFRPHLHSYYIQCTWQCEKYINIIVLYNLMAEWSKIWNGWNLFPEPVIRSYFDIKYNFRSFYIEFDFEVNPLPAGDAGIVSLLTTKILWLCLCLDYGMQMTTDSFVAGIKLKGIKQRLTICQKYKFQGSGTKFNGDMAIFVSWPGCMSLTLKFQSHFSSILTNRTKQICFWRGEYWHPKEKKIHFKWVISLQNGLPCHAAHEVENTDKSDKRVIITSDPVAVTV